MDLDDPEHAQGMSAVLWDLCLLSQHYHPTCAAAAHEVANLPLSGAIAPPPGSHAPSELAKAYSTLRGDFNPPIPEPPTQRNKPRAPIDQKKFVDAYDESFKRNVINKFGDAFEAVEARAFRRHFRRVRAHGENFRLRRERDALSRKISAMRAHELESQVEVKI